MSTLSIATDGYLSENYKTLSIASSGYLDILSTKPPDDNKPIINYSGSGGFGNIKVNNKRINTKEKTIINSRNRKILYQEDDEVLNILKMFLHCQPQ